MKRPLYILILLIILLSCHSPAGARQKGGKVRVIKKEFPAGPDTRVKVSNSFGDVTCELWDQPTVAVEVTLSVETQSESDAGKIFSKIDIVFTESNGLIEMKTVLARGLQSKGHFSIDYLIRMPGSVPLDLTNKFGDVMIAELHAKSAIRVEYGKASLGRLTHGDNLLEISFGSASIQSLKGAVVSVQFSKMRLDYAGSLKINSKYTDVRAGEVVMLDGRFEGGSLEFDRAAVLLLKNRYSSFRIGQVDQKVGLDMEFGSFKAEKVGPGFRALTVECKHGSVICPLPPELSYSLDVISRFGSVRFDKTRATFTMMSSTGQEEMYQGRVGQEPTATVQIRNEFGSVIL